MQKSFSKIWFFLALILVLLSAPLVRIHADCPGTADVICNPISSNTVPELAIRIINFLLSIIGTLSILFIIIGGFQYVTSAGNEDAAKKGRATITYAIIGLIAAILSFLIVRVSVNSLSNNKTINNSSSSSGSTLVSGR